MKYVAPTELELNSESASINIALLRSYGMTPQRIYGVLYLGSESGPEQKEKGQNHRSRAGIERRFRLVGVFGRRSMGFDSVAAVSEKFSRIADAAGAATFASETAWMRVTG
jgi:hypothetical protein